MVAALVGVTIVSLVVEDMVEEVGTIIMEEGEVATTTSRTGGTSHSKEHTVFE